MIERARAALPELPTARAQRLERERELAPATARLLAFRPELGDFFERAAAEADGDHRALANWVVNELAGGPARSSPRRWRAWWPWSATGGCRQAAAKQVLAELVERGGDPAAVVAAKGLAMAGGDELERIIERALDDQADAVAQVAGNDRAQRDRRGCDARDQGPRRRR